MSASYDLGMLDPNSFEGLVNDLVFTVLGNGQTTFGPGADGGRDGLFEGKADYPSPAEQWEGTWYIQAKHHRPHLSKDPQKWLLEQISKELKSFLDEEKGREWPDIWIVVSNIEPTGKLKTGTYDKAREMVKKASPGLEKRFKIWGGAKVISLLNQNDHIRDRYLHFMTAGNVVANLISSLADSKAGVETILRSLIVNSFNQFFHMRLEDAGADSENRPGVHKLYRDLPFRDKSLDCAGLILHDLSLTSALDHRPSRLLNSKKKSWGGWFKQSSRSRIWFIMGGPGQGKSTAGQYYSQIHRAALILQGKGLQVVESVTKDAESVKKTAERSGCWPDIPRIPILIELKDFASWFEGREEEGPTGVLTYLAAKITKLVEEDVTVGILKRMLAEKSWFFNFDGLDEVPQTCKDKVAAEIIHFVNNVAVEIDSDLMVLCSSRPQGYSGQFESLAGVRLELSPLPPDVALQVASPLLKLGRSVEEFEKSLKILSSAMETPAVAELMTTPLQSHIMAVVVKEGGRPPEKRWQLFDNFFKVILKRETNKEHLSPGLQDLLRRDARILRSLHNRVGFVLHARAENVEGASSSISKDEFRRIVEDVIRVYHGEVEGDSVDVVMDAAENRLVLINTPDDGNYLRYDVRQLQEFFAAEALYESSTPEIIRARFEVIAGDAHWREVAHFLISALIEKDRYSELVGAAEALNQIDDCQSDSGSRMLYRRLGNGAHLLARLAFDGVLDTDVRVRKPFKKLLDSGAGCDSFKLVELLTSVTSLRTKAWLIDGLIERVKEATASESIGALRCLTKMEIEDSRKRSEVRGLFEKASVSVRRSVLEFGDFAGPYSSGRNISDWIFVQMVKELVAEPLRSESFSFYRECFFALSVINIKGERLRDLIMTEAGITKIEFELLKVISDLQRRRYSGDKKIVEKTELGDFYELKGSWKDGSIIPEWIDAKAFENVELEARGILTVVGKIVQFACNPNPTSAQELGFSVREVTQIYDDFLRFYFRGYIPAMTRIDLVAAVNNGQFDSLEGIEVEKMFDWGSGDGIEDKVVFDFVDEHPKTAVMLFSIHFRRSLSSHLVQMRERDPFLKALGGVFLRDVEFAKEYFPVMLFLISHGVDDSPALRECLLRVAVEHEHLEIFDIDYPPSFKFSDINSEIGILPCLVKLVISASTRRARHGLDGMSGMKKLLKENCSLTFPNKGYFETSKALAAESQDLSFSVLFFETINNAGEEFLSEHIPAMLDYYGGSLKSWKLEALLFLVDVYGSQEDPWARRLVSDVSEKCRDRYWDRLKIEGLLSKWRENSLTPVTSSKNNECWLSLTSK